MRELYFITLYISYVSLGWQGVLRNDSLGNIELFVAITACLVTLCIEGLGEK